MVNIRNVEFSFENFANILHLMSNKDLESISTVCKSWSKITKLFYELYRQPKQIELKNKFSVSTSFKTADLNSFKTADSTSFKTMMQWKQAFLKKEEKAFEEACKQDTALKEKVAKQVDGLFTTALPMANSFLNDFDKLNKESDEFPVNVFDMILNGVFQQMPAINQILDPDAAPVDKKIMEKTYNMVSEMMHHIAKPENLTELAGMATAFAKSNFDENTPFGDATVPILKPIFEMIHPIMARHMGAQGTFSTEEEMSQMFASMKKELNEEYGSLKDYLQKSKTPDEILEETLIEFTGMELDTLKTLDYTHPLANYQVDISNPKTDYEKGLVVMFSNFPSSLQAEIKPMLSKLVGLMYMSAGCETPEEFQERTEKLLKLKNKAAEHVGRVQNLKHHREQIIAMLTAQPDFDLLKLDKVHQLFDIMEKDENVEKSFNSIYQKAIMHQLTLFKSMLNVENMEEEFKVSIFDPLFSAKATHYSTQKMLAQMSVYWKDLTQNITDPGLKLQYDVAGFELHAIIPSSSRCALHDKYERELMQVRGSNLLASGNSVMQANPIKLSQFDRTVWNYLNSANDIKEQMNLLKMIPQLDEQIIVETLVKQTNDNHQSMIKAFSDEIKIEEIND